MGLRRKKRRKDRHCPRPARKTCHWLRGKKKLQRRRPRENLQNHPTLKRNLTKSHLTKVRRKRRQKVNQNLSRRRKILNQKKSLRNRKTSPHLPGKCLWASPRMQLSLTYLTRVKRRRKKKRTTRTRRLEFNPRLLLPYNNHLPGSTHLQKHPPSQKLHLRMRTRRTPMTDSSLRLRSHLRMRIKKTPTVTEAAWMESR